MSQEWNLKARGHVCTLCQAALEDGAPVVSALRATDGGYVRYDCHVACWRDAARDWEPFSQWDGVYHAPPVKAAKAEPLRKEDAGELLKRLVALDDPAMKNVVYVLAVLLERAKTLVERDRKELEDGTIRRVYEERGGGDTFVILDPRIRLENLGAVQQEVVALLSGTKTLGEVAGAEESAAGERAAGDADASADATPA